MKKKIIWWIIGVIFFLVIITLAFTFVFFNGAAWIENEMPSTPAKEIPCEDIRNEFERSVCFMNRAIKEGDESFCEENITFEDHRTMCLAVIRADESLCEKISLESIKDGCFWNVAGEKFSGDICEKIMDEADREDCFYHMATDIRNETVCKKMSQGHRKDRCFRIIAELKKSEAICDNIDSEDTKYWCLAIVKVDGSLCEKMSRYSELCLNDVEEEKLISQ